MNQMLMIFNKKQIIIILIKYQQVMLKIMMSFKANLMIIILVLLPKLNILDFPFIVFNIYF